MSKQTLIDELTKEVNSSKETYQECDDILSKRIFETKIRAYSHAIDLVNYHIHDGGEKMDINHIENVVMNVINDFVEFVKPSREANAFVFDILKQKICFELQKYNLSGGWISVDELPTQSDQYWVAYHPISTINPNEKTKEICYCTAHFNELIKEWSVKDQLFYTQRQCKVLFWQPIPQPPKE